MSRRPPPAGPYDHDHQPGGPVRPGGGGGGAGGAGRPPHSAGHGGVEYDYGAPPPHRLERTHTDPNMEEPPLVPHINRSATVPAESAAPFPPPVAQPLYPGQSTYRDPAVAPPTRTYTPVLQSTVPPPRPSTAGGGAPRPTAPRVNTNVASSTGYYPQSASSQLSYHDRDPYSSPHDVLNSYHEPPVAMTAHIEEEEDDDDEADMPNFDAMPDVGGHGTPIDEHLPGLEDPRPKPPAGAGAGSGAPGYAAYNPGFAAQAHRARSQPNLRAGATTTTNQFDNAGFQFGLDAEAAPPMPPPVGRQDSRTGYGSNRPTPGGGGGGGGGGQQQSGYGDPMQYASPQSPVSIRGPPGGYGDLRGGYPARGPTPQQSLRSNNGPPRPYRINQGAGGTEESAPFENPDGLSHPPAPFRPGLDQGSKPMPVRQYNNSPAPGAAGVPPRNLTQTPAQQMPPPSAPASGPGNGGGGGNGGAAPTGAGAGTGKSAAVPSTPVTREELADLQVAVRSRPNDYKTALTLVKKLVEASTVLVGDERRVDAKTRAKTREKFVVDAYKLVKKLAHDGYPDAQFFLADCYGQGLLGLAADPKEAFSLYHSAAKAGHPQSAYRVAVCCEIGTEEGGGTKRDPFKAVQWYKRAAALGDPPAMYKMGMIMLKGLLGQARNPREGISWLKRAADRADADNPHALHELALMYESAAPNDIIVRDEDYARQLFHDAAELGYKFSQFRLGQAYEHGHLDLPVDQRQSIFWYTKAAAQGEHQSELALSGWYLTGADGILEQSDTEAYLWARKAASARLAKAEYAMGYFTEVGIGTASNLDDAKRWYWRAAAQGFPKARERLEDLKRGGTRMQKTRLSRSNVRQSEGDCLVM
ncbi:hypothetical protein ASPZODRAFT_136579 [Penicilliopsis zonata CBS 506.65]|uniref:Uncharacterized protein n=1 Tax=Penicilliopsis zonata CBS 506.65 TaxID=1073090 RepID=A0A1L9S7B6_9EURO|nr:hypothetical protein ASPZODRAFT_136579 [Penicilliopsis zonata CBS 506.65]OJJ43038.1 hypothetical protein ASPZODRAFT_136579 [Penicilliopsis zonata CBS 506.65]